MPDEGYKKHIVSKGPRPKKPDTGWEDVGESIGKVGGTGAGGGKKKAFLDSYLEAQGLKKKNK